MTGVPAAACSRPRRADVVAAYDLGVERYQQLWSPVIMPAAKALIPWLGLVDGSVVLDVGAGTGALVDALRAVRPTMVVALDASREMLRVAHASRGVPAIEAEAMQLPVAAAAADAVVMAYVLFHLADPGAALVDAARVLRPGGRVGTVTWAWERDQRAQQVCNQVLADANVPAAPLRRVDAGLDTVEAMDAKLRRAGFTPLGVWPHRLRRQWDSQSFWALAAGSGVNRQRLHALSPSARASLLARLKAQFDQLTPEDLAWEGEVICAVAEKPGDAPSPSHWSTSAGSRSQTGCDGRSR